MRVLRLFRRNRWSSALAITVLLAMGPLAFARAVAGQQGELPDLAALEAGYEQAFAAALEMSEEGEPMSAMQAWGAVMMSAVMLDRAQRVAAGEDPSSGDAEAVTEQVLQRWQRLRPQAAGPSLFRTFQIQDPEQKRAAVLDLLDRYPDDPLAVSQAIRQLRQAGEIGQATQAAEDFVARNPDRSVGYRMLAGTVMGNETRQAEVLERWARALPGDPQLVQTWMASQLPRQEREATARVLSDFFERRPQGATALQVCRQVMRRGDASFVEPARDCVARIATDPDANPKVADQAMAAMAEIAAADGDWSQLMDALDAMDPSSRVQALLNAASRLEAPERCDERIELLAVTTEVLGDYTGGYPLITSSLRDCVEEPTARDLYLSLLRQAPSRQVAQIVSRSIVRVNDVYRGEVPQGTVAVLENRLQTEPAADDLYRALYLVYQVEGTASERFELLRRWHRQAPSSMRAEQATALAWMWIERDEPQAATELLEQQLEARFSTETAEMLWGLYFDAGNPERADLFAADLIAAGDSWRVTTGHLLTARSAAAMGDLGAAERHYWQALEAEYPRKETAVELLYTLSLREDTGGLETAANRICETTNLAANRTRVPECAADLLTRAGQYEAAAGLLVAESRQLPDDPESLRKLAQTAESAGELEVAERALRRAVEIDPRASGSWVKLGAFLERQGRVEELENLLERSRQEFSPPPSYLHRSTGRALTAAGQPRRAIEVLQEARSGLPDTAGGEWSRDWINHELRQAYGTLGSQARTATPASGPRPIPSFADSEPAETPEGDPEALRQAAEALQSGKEGRYDPDTAFELFARAAAMGDPASAFRLALIGVLDRTRARGEGLDPQRLYRQSVQVVQALASDGDPYSQYLVGTAALVGLSGAQDVITARQWLELAADQGEVWALHNLAWMRETGRGFEYPDPGSALDLYRRASEAGNAVSMHDFARLTLVPYGSEALCAEGLQWLGRSAEAGNARAAATLGKYLLYGQGDCVKPDPAASLPWLEAGARTHLPGADYDLAMALLLAGDDPANRAQGKTMLEQRMDRPDARVAETVAFLEATGLAGPRRPSQADRLMVEAARLGSDGFHYLRRDAAVSDSLNAFIQEGIERLEALAQQEDSQAAAFLTHVYWTGLGGQADIERTVSLARQAAGRGQPVAMRILSAAYQRGQGVEQDSAASLRWKRRCAEAGDAFCMMFYGNSLMKGEELERDLEAGLVWLRRAAETGNWWAIQDLGHLYDEGWYGLPRDPDEAAVWKRQLADLGNAEAAGWLLYNGYRR